MLTAQEEQVLRQVARDNTPMQVVNPGQAKPSDETFIAQGRHLERLIERNVRTPRERMGMSGDGKRYEVPGEEEIVRRVGHTMKKGEQLIQWFARTGLGRSQILQMDRGEITRFVEQAERNNLEGPREPEPNRLPAAVLHGRGVAASSVKLRTTTTGFGWDDSDVKYT